MSNLKYKVGDKITCKATIEVDYIDGLPAIPYRVSMRVFDMTVFIWATKEDLEELFNHGSAEASCQKEQYISPFTGETV